MSTTEHLTTALADRYRIEREIGSGGMATVYLAEDVRHRRRVALKVLHPELSAVLGPERFLKEIEVTASLQHPHILPLFDSGEASGQLFYVMPLVDGETLRGRLERERQLPVPDALRIAREVAEALQYAHERGVIHRDIKPENILLQGGHALVADFGIALAVQQAGGQRMTQTGLSLGTPQYMAPEQAMGERTIDARADVYALGAVTYEMLAGEPPFTGPTAQAIVARVMTDSPRPIGPQRPTVPDEAEAAVMVALAKLPADRWGTAREFAQALAGATASGRTGTGWQKAGPAPRRTSRYAVPALAATTLLATAAAVWSWLGRPETSDPPVTRVRIVMSPGQDLVQPAFLQRFALSSDGARLAYVGEAPNDTIQLWLRERAALDARPVPGTLGAVSPFFSPDGTSLAFAAPDLTLRRIPLGGGDVVTLADSLNPIAPGGVWLGDGTVVYTGHDWNLHRVPASGGTPAIAADDSLSLVYPHALPRTDAILATGCEAVCDRTWLGIVDLGTGRFRRLIDNAVSGWYSPTGHIVFVRRSGAVLALPFDLDALEVRGEPVPLFDGVQVAAGIVPSFTLTSDGTLLYSTGGASFGVPGTIMRVTRAGDATPLDPAWPASEIGEPALSADGKQLAVSALSGGRAHIWIKQLDRGTLSRLTSEGELNLGPTWRPDGTVGYVASAGGWHIRFRRSDGTGTVSRIATPEVSYLTNLTWSPDGNWVVFQSLQEGRSRVDAIRLGTDSLTPIVAAPNVQAQSPTLSPDGRWLAYASTESGRLEVYVRPFPDVTRERRQISARGGRAPVWARDGRELYFVDAGDELMAVPVTNSPQFRLGEPQRLFSTRSFLVDPVGRSFAPEAGGRSFLMIRAEEARAAPHLVMVLNWTHELNTKLRTESQR